ncbi:MAG: YkgJ family cysteine cluster protein [Vulcanimicrobiaceae bacterium]
MSDVCATCIGLCCYDVLVRVTGYDAWRIKRAQALNFEQFLMAGTDTPAGPGAFLIAGERRALYLEKNAANPRACTFLMHLPDDVRRCGIYAERPSVCAVYPMTFTNGSVALRSDVRCEASNWNMATITYPFWRRNLLVHTFETHLYQRVADHWNETAGANDGGSAEYYAYVERCFDGIDARRSDIAKEAFDDLIARWQQPVDDTATKSVESFLVDVDRLCSMAFMEIMQATEGPA